MAGYRNMMGEFCLGFAVSTLKSKSVPRMAATAIIV